MHGSLVDAVRACAPARASPMVGVPAGVERRVVLERPRAAFAALLGGAVWAAGGRARVHSVREHEIP
eukprot:6611551-Pyramimonas_sp.AAC.1